MVQYQYLLFNLIIHYGWLLYLQHRTRHKPNQHPYNNSLNIRKVPGYWEHEIGVDRRWCVDDLRCAQDVYV